MRLDTPPIQWSEVRSRLRSLSPEVRRPVWVTQLRLLWARLTTRKKSQPKGAPPVASRLSPPRCRRRKYYEGGV